MYFVFYNVFFITNILLQCVVHACRSPCNMNASIEYQSTATFRMAHTRSGQGLIPIQLIMCPKYSMICFLNLDLALMSLNPTSWILSNTRSIPSSCYSLDCPYIITSSIIVSAPSIFARISDIRRWNISEAEMIPKRIRWK